MHTHGNSLRLVGNLTFLGCENMINLRQQQKDVKDPKADTKSRGKQKWKDV